MHVHDVKEITLTAGNRYQIRISEARVEILQDRIKDGGFSRDINSNRGSNMVNV